MSGDADAWPPDTLRRSEITDEEARAMLRAALNLLERWKLNGGEALRLLGQPAPETYQCWRAGQVADLSHDTVCRLGHLLGIHKALRRLFAEPERGYAWIKKPNAAFGGRSALDRMLAGAPGDLSAVRTYLDGELGDFQSTVEKSGQRS